MKKALYRLQSYYDQQATETEKGVLRYILDNPRQVTQMDIHTLATETYCSASTIVRICQKNGFKGFKELKYSIINDLKYNDELFKTTLDATISSDAHEVINEVLNTNIRAINDTYHLIDYDDLLKMVDLIDKANHIRLFGMGASFIVAKDFQQKFERIGKVTTLYEETHMSLLSASNAKSKGELCILISYSGQTSEVLDMAKEIKKNGCTIIAITRYDNNKLMQLADYVINVPVIEASLRIGASSSRISQLIAVDILFHTYMGLIKEKSMDRILSTKALLPKEEE